MKSISASEKAHVGLQQPMSQKPRTTRLWILLGNLEMCGELVRRVDPPWRININVDNKQSDPILQSKHGRMYPKLVHLA